MKKFRIKITKKAQKDIRKASRNVQSTLIETIDSLANNPRPPQAKPMKGGFKGYWRVRTGDYRIIYEIRDEELVVIVIRAGHRRDIYK